MPSLLIENVDLVMLENQRKSLAEVLAKADPEDNDTKTCEGLLNMLDYWSDQNFIAIRVVVKGWFDKACGNSYFSARVWVEDEQVLVLPIQYGGSEHGVSEAIKALAALPDYPNICRIQSYWSYCEENKMKLDYDKVEGCLKRDVKAWGEK